MELTLGNIDRALGRLCGTFDSDQYDKIIDEMPIKLCRYNTEQVIDRIVLQIRGGLSVTIHTADAGLGGGK